MYVIQKIMKEERQYKEKKNYRADNIYIKKKKVHKKAARKTPIVTVSVLYAKIGYAFFFLTYTLSFGSNPSFYLFSLFFFISSFFLFHTNPFFSFFLSPFLYTLSLYFLAFLSLKITTTRDKNDIYITQIYFLVTTKR